MFRLRPNGTFPKKEAAIVTDEQWSICPYPHELVIEQLLIDDQLDKAERECRVRPGADWEPHVRLAGQHGRPGIDNNHVRAFGATLGNRVCLREPGIGRIVPPQKDRICILVVRRRHPAAEGEGMREIFMPVTNLGGIANIGTAKRSHKPLNPVDAVG
jgi:hypothetical protein